MLEIEVLDLPEIVNAENRSFTVPEATDDLQAEVNDFIGRLVMERDATLFEG